MKKSFLLSTCLCFSVMSQQTIYGVGSNNPLDQETKAAIPDDIKLQKYSESCENYSSNSLKELRETRTSINPKRFPISDSIGILCFLENQKSIFGTSIIADSDKTAELLIDFCDIVNRQSEDFKNRYDVLIEQWKESNQLPFSLFTFDRIAQVFHFYKDLFKVEAGTAYVGMLKMIVDEELPQLKNVFMTIHELEKVREKSLANCIFQERLLMFARKINTRLDTITSSSDGKKKNEARKNVRQEISSVNLKRLSTITAMAQDYLTLERIEKTTKLAESITDFKDNSSKEAFLAILILVGELSTNKNLSTYVKQFSPLIPWSSLVAWRDAIEHQDENGYNIYFSDLINGNSDYFIEWKKELLFLGVEVARIKKDIWQEEHKDTFEKWLVAELTESPIYGVVKRAPTPQSFLQYKPEAQKVFRKSDFYKKNSQWFNITNGTSLNPKIDYYVNIKNLCKEIDEVKTNDTSLPQEPQKKLREATLNSYESLLKYVWYKLKLEATHLSEKSADSLIDILKKNIADIDIAKYAIAILRFDAPILESQADTNSFLIKIEAVEHIPLIPIIASLRSMKLTKKSPTPDKSKSLDQSSRKDFAQSMFDRTSEHLHTLVHTAEIINNDLIDYLNYHLIQGSLNYWVNLNTESTQKDKMLTLKQLFDTIYQQYGCKHVNFDDGYKLLVNVSESSIPEAFKKAGIDTLPKFPDQEKLLKEKTVKFFLKTHHSKVEQALKDNPVIFLASVYSVSIAAGAIREWTLREENPTDKDKTKAENLRNGRNFIAHGDILRNISGVGLKHIMKDLFGKTFENLLSDLDVKLQALQRALLQKRYRI